MESLTTGSADSGSADSVTATAGATVALVSLESSGKSPLISVTTVKPGCVSITAVWVASPAAPSPPGAAVASVSGAAVAAVSPVMSEAPVSSAVVSGAAVAEVPSVSTSPGSFTPIWEEMQ